ncbi:MAG TPA: LLM class F420-dependent oxidoreductase [Dehalococcoidia bacterium]|nr:LLM class F420-dependent oxidoreductase [Dehalococcoidia bacterium]
MKLGIHIPNIGPVAGPEGITKVAQKAEELGYETIWTTERVLFPVNPLTGYGGMEGVPLPEAFKQQLDPLDTLVYAAAVTKRVKLGTSVLVFPYYNPVMLARRITTLDVLSGGRAVVGLGLGWSPEEFEAAGVPMKGRGARADEAIQLMKTIWSQDPAEFSGKYYKLAKSIVQPKPVQKPHPPIYMAAYTPGAMKRVATMADAWLPVGVPLEGMQQMWEGIKSMAREAGRNPDALKLVVRANVAVLPEAQGEGRYMFAGSKDEVKADIQATKDLGAHEIEFDPSTGPQGETLQGFIDAVELMRELAG